MYVNVSQRTVVCRSGQIVNKLNVTIFDYRQRRLRCTRHNRIFKHNNKTIKLNVQVGSKRREELRYFRSATGTF